MKTQLIFLLLSATICYGYVEQTLNGDWSVIGDDTGAATYPATVPGGIFTDLMSNGVIGDIFAEGGDSDYAWVGTSNWTYSRTFPVDDELLSYKTVRLVFEGLDTFATISINGVEVGHSENMFVRYVFDVKDALQVGDNEIQVAFTSAVTRSLALAEDPSNAYNVPPDCPPLQYEGICHVNRIRKMQASFSWDWGPAFASVGIWKNVYLQGISSGAIDYVLAATTRDPATGDWKLWVTSIVTAATTGTIRLNLETNAGRVQKTMIQNAVSASGTLIWSTWLDVSQEDVSTWWPNGYGTQDLYYLTSTFIGDIETVERTVRVGFRTVELVQDPLEKGTTFYFKINDVPIFAKGTNEIPVNVLPELGQDPETVRRLLGAAKSSHMNMIRVWGGGVYESDAFYDLADEYGIMIWQDIMFACAMYPTDADFLSSVGEEVRHQVRRLTSHPSVVIWSGNNENEGALRQNWYGTETNFSVYLQDYVTLYVDTVEKQLMESVPYDLATFITSSPTNGVASEAQGYVALNPADPLYGDVHFYDYGNDGWAPSTFPIPRFASEYGYQSYPSWDSWLTVTDNLTVLDPLSDFMENRQHHPDGNTQNLDLIATQLQLPATTSAQYFQAIIYLSQILQAQAIKVETEHYRSFKGRLNDNGNGNTMGALYWQLNDVWVGPTWSGIDFTGRWKMLHYFTRDFFNPLIITGTLTTANDLELYAVYDGLEVPADTYRALVRVYTWNSLTPLISVEFPVTLDASKAVLVSTLNVPSALYIAGCGSEYDTAKKQCFFHLRLIDQSNMDVGPVNYIFPEKLMNSNLYDAVIEITSVTSLNKDNTEFDIGLKMNNYIALFVWLDAHEISGTFSENGFIQVEGSKTVRFTADEGVAATTLAETLTITHLRDPANR